MDDWEEGWRNARHTYRYQMSVISIVTQNGDDVIRTHIRPADEFDILLEFEIEIIEWTYAEPIENRFGRRY